jgi:polar amino acid transport system substrate-binding protein
MTIGFNVKSGARRPLALGVLLGIFMIFLAGNALAQSQPVPNFWHPGERLAKPDLSTQQRLRFLTTTDFPPFNFIDRRRRLTGFNVDIARAICDELGILAKCQIQALPWEELGPALERGDGDAIIAGLEITAATRAEYEFSRPYLQVPARFAAKRDSGIAEPLADAVTSRTTGVVEGSAQARWFAEAFVGAKSKGFATRTAAFKALKAGEIDLLLGDAVSLSFWLASQDSADCCVFVGGPYLSERHFGRGMAIAFPRGRGDLATATDYALTEMASKGVFAEIYLKYFPLGLF